MLRIYFLWISIYVNNCHITSIILCVYIVIWCIFSKDLIGTNVKNREWAAKSQILAKVHMIFKHLNYCVVWRGMMPIDSFIWKLGVWGLLLLDRHSEVWPYWRWCAFVGGSLARWGRLWWIKYFSQVQGLSLPAACGFWCRALSYFSRTMSCYVLPQFSPWWHWIKPVKH